MWVAPGRPVGAQEVNWSGRWCCGEESGGFLPALQLKVHGCRPRLRDLVKIERHRLAAAREGALFFFFGLGFERAARATPRVRSPRADPFLQV